MIEQLTLDDICANRHGGNTESVEANPNPNAKERDRLFVLREVRGVGARGITLDELCAACGRLPNQLSGRFTELKRAGEIMTRGRRPTRTGASASVYIIP